MIRFGVIGTSWITDHFIDAGRSSEGFELAAVYSRTQAQAEAFAAKHGIPLTFTSLTALASSPDVDAVYVASPNALHAEQAIACMQGGKHVLIEKPAASNAREYERMAAAAKENGVLLMEAMKSTFTPTFLAIREHLGDIGPVRRYFASYCQYSDSYGEYVSGGSPNVFDPAMSAGALMDLGVYCLYPLVSLFGAPERIVATGRLLAAGADVAGGLLLKYPDMEAVVQYSKMTDSYAKAEIQGENGTILFEKISRPDYAEIRFRNGTSKTLTVPQEKNAMAYEVREFIGLIERGAMESAKNSHVVSLATLRTMDEARRQMGVTFPADR
ncbi:Gfo/Idh/MocA family protein [Cohnella suwonensis]|uniref:Gfo/Idh/MocA family protein n=1 Tax=Cohnella suwonensis TaxID=696072 RepID=A0ABW0M1J4_9BACL